MEATYFSHPVFYHSYFVNDLSKYEIGALTSLSKEEFHHRVKYTVITEDTQVKYCFK